MAIFCAIVIVSVPLAILLAKLIDNIVEKSDRHEHYY